VKALSLLIVFVLATLSGVAQNTTNKSNLTVPNDTIMGAYLGKAGSDKYKPIDPFVGKEVFERFVQITAADIIVEGKTDTSKTTAVYYGKVWNTWSLSGMPRIFASGKDSSTIDVKYRWITFSSGVWGAGPWLPYAGRITVTTPRTGRDTLIQGDPAAMPDTLLARRSPGYIQFRYEATSTKAKVGAGQKQFLRDTNQNKNYSFVGEMILVFRREEGR